MGTINATRFDPMIRAFYERLLAAGKPKKITLRACRSKLLTILNAMVCAGPAWNRTFATQP